MTPTMTLPPEAPRSTAVTAVGEVTARPRGRLPSRLPPLVAADGGATGQRRNAAATPAGGFHHTYLLVGADGSATGQRRNAAATPASTGMCSPVVRESSPAVSTSTAAATCSGRTSRPSSVRFA